MNHTHTLWHQHTIPGHSHAIPAHSHRFTIPAHDHQIELTGHTHSLTIPEHSHDIQQGIFRFGSPTGAQVQINGATKASMTNEREVDLTEYLLNDSGKIPRGSWIRLGVLPNDLAYITIDVYIQGFVQSRGGRNLLMECAHLGHSGVVRVRLSRDTISRIDVL